MQILVITQECKKRKVAFKHYELSHNHEVCTPKLQVLSYVYLFCSLDAAREEIPRATVSDDVTRYEVTSLTLGQVSDLRNALYKLQNDQGPNGFEAIAGFHGLPGLCPENAGTLIHCFWNPIVTLLKMNFMN